MVGRQDHAARRGCARARGAGPGSRARIAGSSTARRASRRRVHPAPPRALVVTLERVRPRCASSRGMPTATRVRSRPIRCREGGAQRTSTERSPAPPLPLWAAQQPLDKRLFGSDYDDVELLGKLVTRGPGWPAAGLAIHMANGALFGAAYALAAPVLPGPPAARGRLGSARRAPRRAGRSCAWSTATTPPAVSSRPDRRPPRVRGQATWRHVLFGLVLGELERRLNAADEFEPPEVPVSSNGHGNIERGRRGRRASPRLAGAATRRSSSVGQSTALVKRGRGFESGLRLPRR